MDEQSCTVQSTCSFEFLIYAMFRDGLFIAQHYKEHNTQYLTFTHVKTSQYLLADHRHGIN